MACAKLPIEKSYWEHSNNSSSSAYSGFDSKSGLRWTIGNDSKNLYLDLGTDSRAVQRTILMRGLTIYLDPSGGKHKSIYFEYPYRQGPRHDFSKISFNSFKPNRNHSFKSPTRAYWKNSNGGMVLNSAMERSAFHYSIQLDTLGYLNYKVTIPLNEIETNGFKNIKDLAVGIVVTPRPNSENGNFHAHLRGGGLERGGFGDGDGSGFGGGYGDGDGDGGYGGRRGDLHQSRGDNDKHGNFKSVNIKVWFTTNMAQS